MKKALFLLIFLIFSYVSGCSSESIDSQTPTYLSGGSSDEYDCTAHWRQFDSQPGVEFAFPDTNVSYWRFAFRWDRSKNLSISGLFPSAQYFSFNGYTTRDAVPIASILDQGITPLEGNRNPYMDPAKSIHDPRARYSILFSNETSQMTSLNDLRMPDIENGEIVEFWYRLYRPYNPLDANKRDHFGGVTLPKVQFHDNNGNLVSCPYFMRQTRDRSFRAQLSQAFRAKRLNIPYHQDVNEDFEFYRTDGAGQYPNGHTHYLVTTVGRADVTVIKFKPPNTPARVFARNRNEHPQEDVRYWSVCLGRETTVTHSCLSDADAKVDSDGYINIVMSSQDATLPSGETVKSYADRQEALNYLHWNYAIRRVIIYRHLLPRTDFEGSITKVPKWPERDSKDQDLDVNEKTRLSASSNLPDDYGPTGAFYSLSSFPMQE